MSNARAASKRPLRKPIKFHPPMPGGILTREDAYLMDAVYRTAMDKPGPNPCPRCGSYQHSDCRFRSSSDDWFFDELK